MSDDRPVRARPPARGGLAPIGAFRSAMAWARAAGGVGARPSLWPTAVRQALVLAPPGWWRRPPFLPVPDRAYLGFRLETMYGGAAPPEAGDLVAYLRWCRSFRRSLR